jgi:bacteriorhodopsin
MSTNYRPGSMGAAEQKNGKRMAIAIIIIAAIIYADLYFGVYGTYLHKYFVRAAWYHHVFSVIAAVLSVFLPIRAIFSNDPKKSSVGLAAVGIVMFAVAILFGAGFNFDLTGIEN